MKLLFSIDALADSGKHCWRRQQNTSQWRSCTFAEPLQREDWRTSDLDEAANWHGKRLKKSSQGLQLLHRPGRFDFLVRGIFAHAVLHRLSAVPLPDKAQMQQQLATHEAGTAWLMYLNLAGQFAMLDTRDTPIIGNLRIAVRGDIASSPQYVGPEAAANTPLVDETYHRFIAGWWEHLQSSRTGIFIPDAKDLKPLADYQQWITNWQAENEQ